MANIKTVGNIMKLKLKDILEPIDQRISKGNVQELEYHQLIMVQNLHLDIDSMKKLFVFIDNGNLKGIIIWWNENEGLCADNRGDKLTWDSYIQLVDVKDRTVTEYYTDEDID